MVDHAYGVLVAFICAFAAEPSVETRRGGWSGAGWVADGEVSEVGSEAGGWMARGWEGGEDAGVLKILRLGDLFEYGCLGGYVEMWWVDRVRLEPKYPFPRCESPMRAQNNVSPGHRTSRRMAGRRLTFCEERESG